MLGPSILMGKIAARAVCDEVNFGEPVIAGEGDQSKTAATLANDDIPDEQTLQSWREVLRQLIAREEPGWVHFRKVHSVVLERAYMCGQCHTEKSPLANTAESLDRRFLTRSCQLCHGARE